MEAAPEALAQQILEAVAECAWRIEQKFSRYRTDSIVHRSEEHTSELQSPI